MCIQPLESLHPSTNVFGCKLPARVTYERSPWNALKDICKWIHPLVHDDTAAGNMPSNYTMLTAAGLLWRTSVFCHDCCLQQQFALCQTAQNDFWAFCSDHFMQPLCHTSAQSDIICEVVSVALLSNLLNTSKHWGWRQLLPLHWGAPVPWVSPKGESSTRTICVAPHFGHCRTFGSLIQLRFPSHKKWTHQKRHSLEHNDLKLRGLEASMNQLSHTSSLGYCTPSVFFAVCNTRTNFLILNKLSISSSILIERFQFFTDISFLLLHWHAGLTEWSCNMIIASIVGSTPTCFNCAAVGRHRLQSCYQTNHSSSILKAEWVSYSWLDFDTPSAPLFWRIFKVSRNK